MTYPDMTNRRDRRDIARLLRFYRGRIEEYRFAITTTDDPAQHQYARRRIRDYERCLAGAREVLQTLYDAA